jgi:hypothetical protein
MTADFEEDFATVAGPTPVTPANGLSSSVTITLNQAFNMLCKFAPASPWLREQVQNAVP